MRDSDPVLDPFMMSLGPRAIAGISGGRTSARMAYMVDAVLSFQNTGEEHEKTLDFLRRIEDDLGKPIYRLEWRSPRRGDPPRMATFEVVSHAELHRKGEPFRDMLECLRSYRRKHKGLGPVAPWVKSRICTAYLKVRTQRRFCESLGWGSPKEYTEYVGFRADEPDRVAKMRGRNADRDTDERAPLAEAGITRDDVLAWWSARPFDLGLPEHLGNCKGCFQKDERDLADALVDPSTDPQFYIGIERDFGPMRRGGRPSYEQVLAEAPARAIIRAAVASGQSTEQIVATVDALPSRRVKLIVAQEREPRHGFSCECDAAKSDDDDLDAMFGDAA